MRQIVLLLMHAIVVVLGDKNCIQPSLPNGAFHVVIAGYRVNTCYDYLFQLGITNAQIYVYQREELNALTRPADGPCGIRVEHRLLLPNRGKEAAAFYDYVESVHDSPPEAVVFLHGHGPDSWHSTSSDVATRIHGYYVDVARSGVIYRDIVNLNRMNLGEDLNVNWRRKLFPD
jgi:Protein of unknown function (DUF3431)